MNTLIRYILSGITLCSIAASYSQETGFGEAPNSKNTTGCLSNVERETIKSIIQSRKLNKNSSRTEVVKFKWPIKQSANYDHSEIIGVSNFVDLDDSFPGNLQDYNCGTRTYDTQSGYNHRGTDIYSWPFTWHKMDHDHIQIVTAAAGTIIHKQDFNADKSCSFNNNQWNAVYVEHSDGSVAWYGHLKANSLTTKEIGDPIEVGEYIGVMGSSGNSTGPHLHLEIYDAGGNLIDPYVGSCNTTTSESWWEEQQNYTIPGINMLATHSSPPSLGCYGSEKPSIAINFQHAETVYFATYFRDQLDASTSSHNVFRPDGSIFKQWTTTSPQFYSGSYWYRSFTLPTSGDIGKWTFQVEYQGETTTEYFYLTDDDAGITLSTQSINFNNYAIGEVISKSFEIMNVGANGIYINEITYPNGFSGNWDGFIHESESKTIQLTFNPTDLEAFSEELTIRFNDDQTINLILNNNPLSLSKDFDYEIYPNPVLNGQISIRTTSESSIELLNLNGQVLLVDSGNAVLDVSSLSSGLYFLKISNGGKVEVEKVLIRN